MSPEQQTPTQKQNHYFRAASVFVGCLLAVFGLRFIAIYAHSVLPRILTNYFFFSTQLLFPYEGLVRRDAYGSHAVFSDGIAWTLTFIHWGFVAAAFAWTARRVAMRYTIAAAIGTIVLIGVATHLVFGLFDVYLELDGP